MIYTKLTTNAMKIAFEAHRAQTDISGVPYIYHPIHLAEQYYCYKNKNFRFKA